MAESISIDKQLQAYRVLHVPTQLTWKQHFANEVFSHKDILECTKEEREKFKSRLDECVVTISDNIKFKSGRICTAGDLINTLVDPKNKDIPKVMRKVLYSTDNGERPIGRAAFSLWNGLQIIDMDIKDANIAVALKQAIFDRLCKFNWFLGVALSSSGKGLHIYTKIQIPENVDDADKKKSIFLVNFRHKYSFVYLACLKLQDEIGFTSDQLVRWMDLAMFKPQQGAFIGYDPHPLINSGFFQDFIYVNFDNFEDAGYTEDWVTHPDLKEIFKRWEWFEDKGEEAEVEVKEAKLLEFDTHNKKHYKHHERWRLANTLVKLYGLEKGFQYLRMICTNDIKDKELQSDCITASRHQKPADVWAINRLNTYHGFKIKLNISQQEDDKEVDCCDSIAESIGKITNPTNIKESANYKEFHITKDQYLSDIKGELLQNIERITLIEAGAGVGKTEMVKMLVREGKRVMMVMPFTSTIKSKVENVDNWYYAYGNRKVKLDGSRGLALTVDKFSRLNLLELKEYGFDYIIIDESHLLFQSEYRPVMPKVIEMISNTEVPIILMSGTPIGETIFFPDLMHLKVIKDDVRKKMFNVHIIDSPFHQLYYMCKAMAKDIVEGRKVLFPTNKGTLFKTQLEKGVEYILQNEYANFEPITVNYYKKSNVGEKFMDDINVNKTIAKTDILMCSTYLSVGVDILDRYQFNIYIDSLWMPQEVEQFANRLRANDLFINLYVCRYNDDGESLNIASYKALNMKLADDEIKDAHSILRLCNAMIERNPVEYKYNSLVSSIIRDNKFVEYNEIDNKYYLNEIAYKVIFFERKYREYVQQLPVLVRGMMYYGYEYTSEDKSNAHIDINTFDEFKKCTKQAYKDQQLVNSQHIDELLEILTEDRLSIYRAVLNGEYEIRKGKDWDEDLVKHVMTVKNIEVFEKVIPLFVSMTKMYAVSDVKEIFEFCKKNGKYNFAAIKRVRLLINMVYNSKKNRLDIPMDKFMKETYKFVDEHPSCTKQELYDFKHDFVHEYARAESTDEIIIEQSPLTLNTMMDTIDKIFNCLVDKKMKKKRWQLSRAELLWQEKETDVQIMKNTFRLAGFMDNLIIGDVDSYSDTQKQK